MSFAATDRANSSPSNALVVGLIRTDSWLMLHGLSKIARLAET
jgi:hypothetical protein